MKRFSIVFEQLTGHPPFPWQVRLYEKFLSGEFPKQCNLPTGLGKTSIIPIWLIALATDPKVRAKAVGVCGQSADGRGSSER